MSWTSKQLPDLHKNMFVSHRRGQAHGHQATSGSAVTLPAVPRLGIMHHLPYTGSPCLDCLESYHNIYLAS